MMTTTKTKRSKTHRVLVALDVPAGAADLNTLEAVAGWLGSCVHDDYGYGPEAVAVYASVEDLQADIEAGDETAIACTLPYDDDEEE